jgi:hypothetical protein
MTRSGNRVRVLAPVHARPSGLRKRRLAFPLVMGLWWAWEDLNLRPHPYQQNAGNRWADHPFRGLLGFLWVGWWAELVSLG